MATELSNHFKYQIAQALIDLDTDSIQCCLMASGFTFNKDTHATWTDCSASELAAGNGYTAGGATLTGATMTEDDTNDRMEVTYADVTWTASGGSIGPTPGAILYDDTSTDDTVIGYLDFGSDQTASDGADFVIKNITIRLT